MPARSRLILPLSVAGLAVLAFLAWQANRAPAPAAASGGGGGGGAAVVVEVAEVRTMALAEEALAVGTLRSNEAVVLRPEVSGRISAIRFEEGQMVRRGVPMVELDAAIQRAELQQARAALALAEADARRTEDLFQRRFVSGSARDEAVSRLQVARAALELATARLARMSLLAPFDGIAGIRQVSVGEYVKDGEALVNLEDISVLKVDFRLPETLLPRLQPGQALEVLSDAVPGEVFAASVQAIDPLVDAQGRAVLVRARLDNAAGQLRPGMFARVRLILAERPAVTVIPEEALVSTAGDVQLVYRVDDGRARQVAVRTGLRRDGMVEVLDGLTAGERVVSAGQLKLRDGAPVRVAAGG
ncbi:efflux RND transporter periplasmic adaptor subunit [Pseudothauera lacus]|uniref:Efflux transporter periplasmic adaptor subunit n=1 Tax=Pseudothauera lacus TaxID=2136175 RepID=A0A2T4IBQ1_9RHOO|nr:efflux RND transporter periplasmic adaptor subunit [Pseudothauera lacus]PTD95192.1 efflux transporter periplasmic adaptor subunit [Pseudothauera lacus]